MPKLLHARLRAVLVVTMIASVLVPIAATVADSAPAAALDNVGAAVDPDALDPDPVAGGGVIGFVQPSVANQNWRVRDFAQIGDRIFVAGAFTTATNRPWDGALSYSQSFLAAYDLTTNDFIDTWRPTLDDAVWALEVYNGNLYVGG